MTQTEFRKILIGTENVDWFNSVSVTIEYPLIDIKLDFEGFSSLYKYVSQQLKGWGDETPLPDELLKSLNYYSNVKSMIENFIASYTHVVEDDTLDAYFSQTKNSIQKESYNNVFPFDSSEAIFLLKVFNNFPNKLPGAFGYITRNLNQNINNKDIFDGFLVAYEFQSKAYSEIVERKNKEKSSITKLTNEFKNSLPPLEVELVNHLKNSSDKYEEYVRIIDDFKTDKEKIYSDWFINTKGSFETFSKESDDRLKDLENVYKEKLKLEEPAKYWAIRGRKLKKQGWIALTVLIILVMIVVISLGELLWKVPEQIYNSFFEGDRSAAIRWSIIYVTFISFMAFSVKAVSKVMFSSFHLARDSEERYTLTYFYLSLLKDAEVSKEEKQLIMQSLFSRADTGLLKEDSSPTMPNDITSKLFGK